MVGGYVILTKTPLLLGDNNLADMYGSIEAVLSRFDEVKRAGKPVYLQYLIDRAAPPIGVWLEAAGLTDNSYIFQSSTIELTINLETAVVSIAFRG